ncbi:hypothetical protein [Gordonia sp. YY1]|uniref:hypothetical protein n=1 Tax=Gordonia sp. YY1 TaxID=396712 RepID=UPI0013314E3B|nr:hypothetical protein [Gordonia sp. YY1]KAF0968327.1 hypothetical protein BPODLACK_03269 [Gordonia sp. YY1]
MTYTPDRLLEAIDANAVGLLVGLGVAMLCQTVWLIEAARVARRDSSYSIPLACTLFWFAHDIAYVVRFRDWFFTYDHWFLQLFWLGLLSAALLEFVFFAQLIRYGRRELAPAWSPFQFTLLIIAATTGSILAWEYLRLLFDDPLYLASSALTLMSYALFGPSMTLRRRSFRGQTLLMWQCFTTMTFAWWIATVAFLPGPFRSWQYLAVGVFTAAVGVAMMIAIRHAPQSPNATEPPRSDLTSDEPVPGTR